MRCPATPPEDLDRAARINWVVARTSQIQGLKLAVSNHPHCFVVDRRHILPARPTTPTTKQRCCSHF